MKHADTGFKSQLCRSLDGWLRAHHTLSPQDLLGAKLLCLESYSGPRLPWGCETWSVAFPSPPAVPPPTPPPLLHYPSPCSGLWRLTPMTTALPTGFRWGLDNRYPQAAVCSDSTPCQQPRGPTLPTSSDHHPFLPLQAGEGTGLPAAAPRMHLQPMLPSVFVNRPFTGLCLLTPPDCSILSCRDPLHPQHTFLAM